MSRFQLWKSTRIPVTTTSSFTVNRCFSTPLSMWRKKDRCHRKLNNSHFFCSNSSRALQVLSDELGYALEDILNIELNFCDTQPNFLGGGDNEFIFSVRLDNLALTCCALRALIDSCNQPGALSNEESIRIVAFFDNLELGSYSVQGSGAPTMFQAMRRIVDCLCHEFALDIFYRLPGNSRAMLFYEYHKLVLVSADMAPGVHPNYTDKYEEHHRPELQKGLVIKHNANQRYATSGVTAFLFKEVANKLSLPTQEFVVRNDMGCGSTIGPILASGVGIRTIDCGIPQLSMHRFGKTSGVTNVQCCK